MRVRKLGCGSFAAGVLAVVCGATPAMATTFPVTSTADGGAGSLREAIGLANAAVGHDTISFAIAGTGPFTIAPSTPLPEFIDGAGTTIDGTTQPGYGARPLLGSGGVVGVDALALAQVRVPIVRIVAPTGMESVIRVRGAGGSVVRGLHVLGAQFAVFVLESPGVTVEQNLVGATDAFGDPGAERSATGIRFRTNSIGAIVRHNLVGFSAGLDCVRFEDGSDGALVEGNEITGCGTPLTPADDAITLDQSGGAVVRANLLRDNGASGVDALGGVSAATIENNTIRGNGRQGNETAGVRLSDENGVPTAGVTVRRNVISANAGAGVLVTGNDANTNAGNRISENSVFANSIGIDLAAPAADKDTGDGVTLDDQGDVDLGGNSLLNFPVIDAAISGSLTVGGWAPSGATIEFFSSDPSPSGFGQGRRFIASRVEGGIDDLDAAVSSFGPGPIGGVAQGADTTNRFRFVLPISGIAPGVLVTATATVAGNTSEFGGLASVRAGEADLAVTKSGPAGVSAGHELTYTIVVTNHGPDAADNVTVVDPIPSGLEFRATGGACTTPFPCRLGLLAAGQSRTLTARYAVPASYAGPNPIVNTASVQSTALDGAAVNDSATTTTRIAPPPGAPPPPPPTSTAPARASLSLTKTAQRRRVRAGTRVRFMIRIANRGAGTARRLRVCDRLPRWLLFVSAPRARVLGRRACWRLTPLAPGARRKLHVRAITELVPRRTHATNVANARASNLAGPTTRRATATITILPRRNRACTTRPVRSARTTRFGRGHEIAPRPVAHVAC